MPYASPSLDLTVTFYACQKEKSIKTKKFNYFFNLDIVFYMAYVKIMQFFTNQVETK
jgi:hypothetical protein